MTRMFYNLHPTIQNMSYSLNDKGGN